MRCRRTSGRRSRRSKAPDRRKGDTNVTEPRLPRVVRPPTVIYRLAAMKLALVVGSALVFVLASSCGDSGRAPGEAGSTSSFVGGTCLNGSECEFTLCQTGPIAPGGTCTSSCFGDSNCSSGSSCAATDLGWICLVDCSSDDDCRTDYSCQEITRAPPPEEGEEATFVNVCAGAL